LSPTHVVILAGGRGARFWPWSRAKLPKPLLPLHAGRTLLEDAWSRARRVAPASRIWVVVPADLAPGVRAVLRSLRNDRLIVEPAPRDTAPAIALACVRIAQTSARARVLVMPSDHAIDDPAAWARDAKRAIDAAAGGALVCLGVVPDGPRAAYGYLVCAKAPGSRAVRVDRFVEKPAIAAARRLLRTGRCLWNAGTFAWRVDSFLEELTRQRADIALAAREAADGRAARWKRLVGRSVDYAVLEGAGEVLAVRLSTGWDDLGSWDVVARRAPPAPARRVILVDAPGSVAFSRSRFVAVVGVPDVVVVDSPDAVLVVARSRAQDVKRVVDALRRRGRKDLL
jgi:mannose-1-phosphate guanylyltransferase